MSELRIGFDGKRALHNFRGLGNYSRGVIEGLLAHSPHHILLYSKAPKDPRAIEWLDTLIQNYSKYRKQDGTYDSKFEYCTPVGPMKLAPGIWRSFFLDQIIANHKVDIYHGLSHEIPHRWSANKCYKSVVTIHDLLYLKFPDFFSPIDRLTYHQKIKYAVSHADLIIAICKQTKKDLIDLLNIDEEKIKVHYQSCDPIFYKKLNSELFTTVFKKYQLNQNLIKNYILNVATFEPNKNQLNLIEAFALIANKIPHHLILIGKGSKYKTLCQEKAETLKISNRVHFLSHVTFSDFPAFYQAASVFCFPSFYEGFGIPIIEALFSNVPVATSQGGCFPESAGPGSLYFDPYSSSQIANALLKILENSNLETEMINIGSQFCQQFHREMSSKKLEELYSRIF